MAAKVLENPNRVWQRVNILTAGARQETRQAIQALKTYLATQGGNPPLQLLTFPSVTTQLPTALTAGGGILYGVFAKKANTATAAFLKGNDSATLAGGAAGINARFTLPLLVANSEVFLTFTPGLVLVTGLTVAAETTAAGGANTVVGDAPSGFAIIG